MAENIWQALDNTLLVPTSPPTPERVRVLSRAYFFGVLMIDRTLPYYKWFWQDWRANRKIQRMSYIERGLYRELLDECWVEGAIPNDIAELADICGCPEQVMADAWQVLASCFELLEDGKLINAKLHSLRTEKDVERLKKAENGKKGGLAKSLKTNEIVASAKQVLSNCHIEEKRKEDKRKEDKKLSTPEGVSESLWKDFLKVRKEKKLALTETALKAIQREADSIGKTLSEVLQICCENGWAGFKASWLEKKNIEQAKAKELPLATDAQIAYAYQHECGFDPTKARFNSYYDMRKFILDFREKKAKATI